MKYKQLILAQRYQIQVLLQENTPKKRIAELINTSVSSIYRELQRNSRKRSYDAKYAQKLCDLRKERIGDLEIDTIIGKDGKRAIVSIVDRRTGFLIYGETQSWETGSRII